MSRSAHVRTLLCAVFWLPLIACGDAYDRASPDYARACYGEREGWQRRFLLADQRLIMTLDAPRKDWLRVRDIMRDTAAGHGLAWFDLDELTARAGMFQLAACHASGVYVSASGFTSPSGEHLTLSVSSYLPTARWQPVVKSLEHAFRAYWKEHVKVQHPVMPPVSKRALPDFLRAELTAECRAIESAPRPDYCEGF